MKAVRYRFRAELRTRWKSIAALALLVGVAGGATLAAVAGARRTAIGVLIGVPLGIVVARIAWKLVAWLPARTAARTRPALVLRSE